MKISNEVAAPMFSDDVGIESAAAWLVSRSVMPKTGDATFDSLIFSRSIKVLRAPEPPRDARGHPSGHTSFRTADRTFYRYSSLGQRC